MSEEATVKNELSETEDDIQNKMEDAILGDMITEKTSMTWSGIVGYEKVVDMLKESVVLPVKFPQLFTGARMAPGVIWLYGHPGAGKTYISKAVINSVFEDVTTFSISSFTTRLARTERFVRTLFKLARVKTPCIILIDEIDRFFGKENDQDTSCVATQFLSEMHKYQENKGIFVIGHTCQPWRLEARIRRRADRAGYLSLPDTPTRAHLFKYHLNSPNTLTEENYQEIGCQSEGCTPSDIVCVARDAMMEGVREIQKATHFKTVSGPSPNNPDIIVGDLLAPCSPNDPDAVETSWIEISDKVCCRHINLADVLNSLERTKPSVSEEETKQFEEFRNKFDTDL